MDSVIRYINHISRLANLYREKELKPYGLGPMHHTYILNICRNPGITQEALAKQIYVNKSNVARQLAVLEERGYVIRKPAKEDARKLLVFPTEKATAFYPVLKEILRKWSGKLLEDYPEDRKEELVKDLMKLEEKSLALLQKKSGERA